MRKLSLKRTFDENIVPLTVGKTKETPRRIEDAHLWRGREVMLLNPRAARNTGNIFLLIDNILSGAGFFVVFPLALYSLCRSNGIGLRGEDRARPAPV